jgi:hypothetical protein
VHQVQHAVDAEPNDAGVTARLEVDVARALLEGVLPQPVDDLHDARVVRIERRVLDLAQVDQLLEADRRCGHLAGLLGRAHVLRQGIELGRVARHVIRRRKHQLDRPPRVGLDVGHPGHVEGFAGRNSDLVGQHMQRQRAARLGIGERHHVGDLARVDAQRIDALERQAETGGQPARQHLGVERGAIARILQAGAAQAQQRVQAGARLAEALGQHVGLLRRQQPVVAQPLQQLPHVEPADRCAPRVRLGRTRPPRG